jgi:alpha-mannosidase
MTDSLKGVHVVEDGEVRTVIEAVFSYNRSVLCQRYFLPKRGTEIKIETRVYWNEQRKMLKLSIPSKVTGPTYLGQTAYGSERWVCDGRETISQKWVMLHDGSRYRALTVINDSSGAADVSDGELRLTLLRSPAYCASISLDPEKYPQISPDRFNPYTDQGEHFFTQRLNAGKYDERIASVTREAKVSSEPPVFVPFTPPGTGTAPLQMIKLSNPGVELVTVKRAENSDEFVIRLFEPTGKPQTVDIELPLLGIKHKEALSAFEIVTLLTKKEGQKYVLKKTDLLEDMINRKETI